MTVTDKTTANGVTVEQQLGARKARTSVRRTARLHAGTEVEDGNVDGHVRLGTNAAVQYLSLLPHFGGTDSGRSDVRIEESHVVSVTSHGRTLDLTSER